MARVKAALADRSATSLYTPELLALATRLAGYPLTQDFAHCAEERSRTCGSTISVGVDLDTSGRVSRIGLQVGACAIGQASAALLAISAKGQLPGDFVHTSNAIEAWLSAESSAHCVLPDWPGFDALQPAREHKGRHGALLLAWTAITQALSTVTGSR